METKKVDLDRLTVGDLLEKEAIWMPFARQLFTKRVAQVYGPHLAQALKNTPAEFENMFKNLVEKMPHGGTAATKIPLAGIAPEFGKALGRGHITAEELNRLLPPRKRGPLSAGPAAPEGLWDQALSTMRRHPVGTAAVSGGLAAGIAKLLANQKREGGGGGGRGKGNVVVM